MPLVTIEELLEAGAHLGHKRSSWHPRAKEFIFMEKMGTHIIDVRKTIERLEKAYNFIRNRIAEGGTILFIGTKKQAQDIVRELAEECGAFYITEKWLGGMLTNFETIRRSVLKMKRLREMKENNDYPGLTKKEILTLQRELTRLERYLVGIEDMETLPSIVYITDVNKEMTAVKEARRLAIPIVAIVDTNVDPKLVDYPIPANDDSMYTIRLITSIIARAVKEGRSILETGTYSEKQPTEAS